MEVLLNLCEHIKPFTSFASSVRSLRFALLCPLCLLPSRGIPPVHTIGACHFGSDLAIKWLSSWEFLRWETAKVVAAVEGERNWSSVDAKRSWVIRMSQQPMTAFQELLWARCSTWCLLFPLSGDEWLSGSMRSNGVAAEILLWTLHFLVQPYYQVKVRVLVCSSLKGLSIYTW